MKEEMLLIRWQSVIDFVVLTGAIYILLGWAQRARAVRIALGIIGLHAGALLAQNYDLAITSRVLSAAGFVAIAVLLLVFQPELRRAFMRLDTMIRSGWRRRVALGPAYRAIAEAAFDLAGAYIGGLVVLVRRDTIAELVQGGVVLGSEVSRELLVSIFQKTSPLHDGAVIVDGLKLTQAGVILPLTLRTEIPASFGTRHRAAMGLADRCDALIIVISEERGTVTLVQDGKLREMPDSEQTAVLIAQLEAGPELSPAGRLRLALTRNLRLKFAAIALAAGVWAVALYTGTTVRSVPVSVAFSGVPAGMSIAAQSTPEIDIQLRGNALMMDSDALNRLVAVFNLSGAKPGAHTLHVTPRTLDLPPGIRFERASPAVVSVRLERSLP
jgi:diadenylate cyclase